MSDLAHNIEVVKNKIADAACGRAVTLVGVSKTVPTERVGEAAELGLTILGENRAQELRDKKEALSHLPIQWHMIGGLQKNKIKYLRDERVEMVQSLDALKLAETMENTFLSTKNTLVQVNIGKEPQKNGIFPENVEKFVAYCEKFDKIKIIGLMCIPPREGDPKTYFTRMNNLFTQMVDKGYTRLKILSMGMSADFEQAIACGSNMVRVGSAIFGSRQ